MNAAKLRELGDVGGTAGSSSRKRNRPGSLPNNLYTAYFKTVDSTSGVETGTSEASRARSPTPPYSGDHDDVRLAGAASTPRARRSGLGAALAGSGQYHYFDGDSVSTTSSAAAAKVPVLTVIVRHSSHLRHFTRDSIDRGGAAVESASAASTGEMDRPICADEHTVAAAASLIAAHAVSPSSIHSSNHDFDMLASDTDLPGSGEGRSVSPHLHPPALQLPPDSNCKYPIHQRRGSMTRSISMALSDQDGSPVPGHSEIVTLHAQNSEASEVHIPEASREPEEADYSPVIAPLSSNHSIIQRRGSMTRSVSVTLSRKSTRRSSDTFAASDGFEVRQEARQRRQFRRAALMISVLVLILVIVAATVASQVVGRQRNGDEEPAPASVDIDTNVNTSDTTYNSTTTTNITETDPTNIYETFEAEFEGICSDGPDGELTDESKAKVERVLLNFFNALAECKSEGYHLQQDEITSSIALIEWIDADACADSGGNDEGRQLQRRRTSRGRFQRRATCRFCDRLVRATKVASSSGRYLVDDGVDCEASIDLVAIIREEGFNVQDAYITDADVLDCSASSSACIAADGGDYACCGAEGCRCRHSSESLCQTEQCNLSQGICCQMSTSEAGTFMYPACEDTPTCKALEPTDIYETFEAEFEGICTQKGNGELTDESKAEVERALLNFFNTLAECRSEGFHIQPDEITSSIALIEWIDADACADSSGNDEGRQLQRRRTSRGRFQRRATCRFCDRLVRATKVASSSGRYLVDDGVDCEASIDLVAIIREEGFNVQDAYITDADVLDCSASSSACIAADGGDYACCGAEGCRCRHSSESLCQTEQCNLSQGICCQMSTSEAETFMYPECEDTPTCKALEPTDIYETFEAEFGGICTQKGNGKLTDESKAEVERALLNFFNTLAECRSEGFHIKPDEITSSIALIEWIDANACADSSGNDEGRQLQRRRTSRGRFQRRATCRFCDRLVRATKVASSSGRYLVDDDTDCEASSNLVSNLREKGFDQVQDAYIADADVLDCSSSSPACIAADGGDYACCGAEGCRCRHSSESLCQTEQCSLSGNWCCAFDLQGNYRYPECEDTPTCKALPPPRDVYDSFEAEFEGICSDTSEGELTEKSRAGLERAILAYLNGESDCETELSILPDEVVSSITLVSWDDGSICAGSGSSQRRLQRLRKSKGRFNKKARCRRCERLTGNEAKQPSSIPGGLLRLSGPGNVFQHRSFDSFAISAPENVFDHGGRRLGVQCENISLADYIQEEAPTVFADVTEANIIVTKEVDCSLSSPSCYADGGDFACCGEPGCLCKYHSETLCLDEQCSLPGGLCCSFDATGFFYPDCSKDCLGLSGQCEDQHFTDTSANSASNDEFYISTELEIDYICGDEKGGRLSSSRQVLLESLLLSYSNNILGLAGCSAEFTTNF